MSDTKCHPPESICDVVVRFTKRRSPYIYAEDMTTGEDLDVHAPISAFSDRWVFWKSDSDCGALLVEGGKARKCRALVRGLGYNVFLMSAEGDEEPEHLDTLDRSECHVLDLKQWAGDSPLPAVSSDLPEQQERPASEWCLNCDGPKFDYTQPFCCPECEEYYGERGHEGEA